MLRLRPLLLLLLLWRQHCRRGWMGMRPPPCLQRDWGWGRRRERHCSGRSRCVLGVQSARAVALLTDQSLVTLFLACHHAVTVPFPLPSTHTQNRTPAPPLQVLRSDSTAASVTAAGLLLSGTHDGADGGGGSASEVSEAPPSKRRRVNGASSDGGGGNAAEEELLTQECAAAGQALGGGVELGVVGSAGGPQTSWGQGTLVACYARCVPHRHAGGGTAVPAREGWRELFIKLPPSYPQAPAVPLFPWLPDGTVEGAAQDGGATAPNTDSTLAAWAKEEFTVELGRGAKEGAMDLRGIAAAWREAVGRVDSGRESILSGW
jgi:hypothetical protein